jgi:hypothetical protein
VVKHVDRIAEIGAVFADVTSILPFVSLEFHATAYMYNCTYTWIVWEARLLAGRLRQRI